MSEEEYNCHKREVGPCRKDFGHIGPDREDLRFEYHYGEGGMEHSVVRKRRKFKKYERLPFFLPETTQQGLYSETLTGLLTSKHKATAMWRNVKDLRFWDGRNPGFMTDPVRVVCAAIKQVIARAHNTIDKLKYDIEDLDIRDVAMNPRALERLIKPKSDMAKTEIITQLSHLALTTRYQVIKMAQYIEKSTEWLIVNDWKLVSRKTKDTIKTLMDFRYILNRSTRKEILSG